MTEIIGGVLMTLGGGLLSASSIGLMAAARPSIGAGVAAALAFTPVPENTPADLLASLEQLTLD